MSTIQPISTTRVTDQMTRGRLTAQIQNDQLDLFRLQNQLSTGQRIFLPSEDPASAQRAIALQRTLERKAQSLTNLNGAAASLATAEASLAGVSSSLVELKSTALAAIDSIASEGDVSAALESIDELFDQLVRVGNSTFTSNYLLGGSERSVPPFARSNAGYFVEYNGDESSPQTFVDIGQIFDTGVSGDLVFGGLSEAVRGTADLNAQLSSETRLSQLNGGVGVSSGGSIQLTYVPTSSSEPNQSTIIDLSQAKTIDDVVRLIEVNAPSDAGVVVTTQGSALRIEAGDGAITIDEVANGRTARELGILNTGTPLATINGDDLDPTLQLTTRFDELVGARSTGRIELPGDNNDLVLTANANGVAFNDVTVRFEDTGTAGAESATFTPGAPGVLTVSVEAGASTATDIAAAINAEATGAFTAETDRRDQLSVAERGAGAITPGAIGDITNVTAGGADGSIDLASGLLITNGGEPEVIDTSGVETVEQLLSVLNSPELGLEATINASGDGIDVRTRRSGASFAIAENGGSTATDLGIRTYTGESRLEDFNRGLGVVVTQLVEKPGEPLSTAARDEQIRTQNTFEITLIDQGQEVTYSIDPIGLETVDDLLLRINGDTGGVFDATLATTGNGIVLTRNTLVDPVDPAAAAQGTALNFAGTSDTLTITADTPGAAGNTEPYTIVFEPDDGLAAGLSSTIDGTTITIQLSGSTPTTAALATEISGHLPDHTVVSDGTATIGALPLADTTLQATGGYDADTNSFTVSGTVAERLGFLPDGEESVTVTGTTLQSTDRKPEEVEGVFTTLARMREALLAGDSEGLQREVAKLDDDIERVAFGRAEVGVRLRNLESISQRLADEEITLRAALSEEIDTDFVEVISEFTAKQASLQASLQTSGLLLNLTILDFI